MAAITRITVRIRTGDRAGAGTDGNVFLGIDGREFRIDSNIDDYERNSNPTYVLGEFTPGERTVNNAARNDPRVDYVLDSDHLNTFHVYVRFDPENESDAWNLESVTVEVSSHADLVARYEALGGSNNLWLGQRFGKFCYLFRSR